MANEQKQQPQKPAATQGSPPAQVGREESRAEQKVPPAPVSVSQGAQAIREEWAKKHLSEAKTATEVLNHLRETGLPSERCKVLATWIEGNEGATAKDLYAFLEESTPDKRDGTLRRTGKYIFGNSFEPENADVAPAEELQNLRDQLTRIGSDLETHKSWLRAARRRVSSLEEENEKLRSELVSFRRLDEARVATA